MIESNVSIGYQKNDTTELRKKSNQIGREVAKMAAELDLLKERIFSFQEEVRRCDAAEMRLISDFDKWIVYYNEVAASRMKELEKRIREIRKKRAAALEELAKARPKVSLLESKCEVLSYKQGEVNWENRLQSVKGRKWKA